MDTIISPKDATCLIWVSKGNDFTNGNGVFVSNYLITAGHVVKNADSITCVMENQSIRLNVSEAIILKYDDNQNLPDYDIAVFKMDKIQSSLTLSETLPEVGCELQSNSLKIVVTKSETKDSGCTLLDNSSTEHVEFIENLGTVTEFEGNLFACSMQIPLEKGNSGSPIFKGNAVLGILRGGSDNGNICGYQSSKSIIELLRLHCG